jgi:uncharacterized membrane protein YdjX (TVP38/TMEM64 family)
LRRDASKRYLDRMTWSRWLLLIALALGLALFLAVGPDEQTVVGESASWRDAARNNLFAALALFFVAEVVFVALSVPIGIWMSALGGFLFGFWIGTAVVSVAAMLGAILAFLAARYVFCDAIHRLANTRPRLKKCLVAIDRGFHDHGAYYVLLLRLTPVIPFWALNLGLGLTCLRLRDYWWATQLGMLPATMVVVNAGASLAEITSLRDLLSWRVIVALSLLLIVPFVLHHSVGRWLANGEHKHPVEAHSGGLRPPVA